MKTEIKGANSLIMPVVFISFLSLLLFFVVEQQQVLPGDTAWFMSAGRRIFLGMASVGDFWDTNPPYNFLFYLPLAAIAEGLKFSPFFVVITFHIGIVLLNAAVIFRIFSERNSKSEIKWLVTVAYFTASLSFFLIGHKDSLIATALLAMTVFQYAIHHRIHTGTAGVIIASVFNALIIFLKPHFLIIPATLIVCRVIREKSFRTLLEYDCLVFSGLGLLYTAVTLFFFPEFVFQRIEVITSLYAAVPYDIAYLGNMTLIYLCLNAAFLSTAFFLNKSEVGKLALYLACVSPLAIFIFYLQAKGFWEHALPAFTFLGMVAFLTIIQNINARSRVVHFLLAMCCVILIGFGRPFPALKETDDFKKLRTFIRSEAGEKNFFVESSTTTLPYLMELELINNQASHFPSLWMLSGFIAQGYKYESECLEVCNVFSSALLEGLKKYDPHILMLYEDDLFVDSINLPRAGISSFLKNNKNFQEFLSAYTRTEKKITIKYDNDQIEERYAVYVKKTTD